MRRARNGHNTAGCYRCQSVMWKKRAQRKTFFPRWKKKNTRIIIKTKENGQIESWIFMKAWRSLIFNILRFFLQQINGGVVSARNQRNTHRFIFNLFFVLKRRRHLIKELNSHWNLCKWRGKRIDCVPKKNSDPKCMFYLCLNNGTYYILMTPYLSILAWYFVHFDKVANSFYLSHLWKCCCSSAANWINMSDNINWFRTEFFGKFRQKLMCWLKAI